jgi:hypothetical protein
MSGTNLTVDHAVCQAVAWAVDRAVIAAGNSTVFNAVYEAVDNAEHWAVTEAVVEVVNEDSEHPALQDFLMPCGAGAAD